MLVQQKKTKNKTVQVLYKSQVLFLLRATSPCLLSEVQLRWLVLSAGCYLGALLNLNTV